MEGTLTFDAFDHAYTEDDYLFTSCSKRRARNGQYQIFLSQT